MNRVAGVLAAVVALILVVAAGQALADSFVGTGAPDHLTGTPAPVPPHRLFRSSEAFADGKEEVLIHGLAEADDFLPIGQCEIVRRHLDLVSPETAFLAETIGTLILALVVFALTDPRNAAAPLARLAPVFIGLTVAILISVIAPLTQACFNPARDLGPRLFASLAGWGNVAIPGPNGIHFITVYILAPSAGALAGGGLYQLVLKPASPASEGTP